MLSTVSNACCTVRLFSPPFCIQSHLSFSVPVTSAIGALLNNKASPPTLSPPIYMPPEAKLPSPQQSLSPVDKNKDMFTNMFSSDEDSSNSPPRPSPKRAPPGATVCKFRQQYHPVPHFVIYSAEKFRPSAHLKMSNGSTL